jgi:hypothetical protein
MFTRVALAGAMMLGITSLAAAQQHRTWYLAEGATNAFFQEEILIANPTSTDANVTVAFLLSTGTEVPVTFVVPKTSRHTLRVNELAGLDNVNASAVVTSDVDILVERSMYWPGPARRGGHNSVGVPAPAPKWYLAEGSLGFFETYVLIANPGNTQAEVKVSYLQEGGGVIERTLSVAARSRRTIGVGDPNDPAGAPNAGAFSTVVETTNGTNIVVERAMYWNGFEGGHNAVGVTAPSLTWRFAEGFTGTGFTTFLLLGNPNAAAAEVNVTFLFDDGSAPLVRPYTLAPNSRTTINANDATVFPELQQRAFSMVVDGTNATPILAERAIYFADFLDGSSTAGLTAEATRWGFAEGLEDRFGDLPYETFYLLANNSDTAATVTATFYLEDGTGIVRSLNLPAKSRTTLSGKAYPELSNKRFAAFFEATNAVNFTAERAVYWGGGRFGGHGSTGTAWTGTIVAPPAPPAVTIASIAANSGGVSGGQAVIITGNHFNREAQVFIGGTQAGGVLVLDAQRILVTTPGHAAGTVDVTVVSNGAAATLPGGFTYVADAPPPPPPNRTPDPPAGQLLPLPNMAGIVAEVAAQYPGAMRNSCGNWEFLDRLIARLRQFDTRWGYNCKRGNCPDLSEDVVAYHAGAGPEVNGALETYTVDVISNHCGTSGSPVPWWAPHQYIPGPGAARWHSRFLF